MRAGIVVVAVALALAPAARAQQPPILGGLTSGPDFTGSPAPVEPVPAPQVPQHPFMAPDGRSNLHEDAYQTDALRRSGPLGDGLTGRSALYVSECASITFDPAGRIVTVCVGITTVTLRILDPVTLQTIDSLELPGRPVSPDMFQNFTGGGYFYLDNQARAVVPTADRRILVVATDGGLRVEREYSLASVVAEGDGTVSALPDWSGRLWFVTRSGVVGTVDPASGAVKAIPLGEPIGNSFAVDSDGSVSIVSDAALYRFVADADGTPRWTWRTQYANDGRQKPGQSQPGSGTTPTLMGDDLVAITDNDDPVHVEAYERRTGRRVCRAPVFERGASSTDQSLVTDGTSLVAENNCGYTGPLATEGGRTTTAPGLARVDVDRAGHTCTLRWTADVHAPTVVPKLALGSGIVYTYTKDAGSSGDDSWWFTALSFADGRTLWRFRTGEGLGFNNNYAPVTIGPDGTAYVGVLGGVVRIADATPPQVDPAPLPTERGAARRVRVRLRCGRGRRVLASIRAPRSARRAVLRRGSSRPVRRRLRGGRATVAVPRGRARTVTVTVSFGTGRPVRVVRRTPRC